VTIGIGELSRQTGLTQQAIRAWESRFGFPTPERTDGGRRQYAVADVDRIQRVMALKESGVRLASAISRVRDEDDEGRPISVYAELRRLHPHLHSRLLRREVLIAISHAVEDEAMSRGSRPHVFGAFQREEFYRRASGRWGEIARTAASCLVFADFAAPAEGSVAGGSVSGRSVSGGSVSGRSGSGGSGAGGPVEVPLAPDAPLLREWAVVVSAPSFSVALTAWEVPRQSHLPEEEREFESLFTFDPAAVRTAAEVCVKAARASGEVDLDLLRRIDDSLATEPTASTGVDALVVRAFDYLQRLPLRG
jgi:DNA-binding transcriptional MerR regulator